MKNHTLFLKLFADDALNSVLIKHCLFLKFQYFHLFNPTYILAYI